MVVHGRVTFLSEVVNKDLVVGTSRGSEILNAIVHVYPSSNEKFPLGLDSYLIIKGMVSSTP